MDIDPKQTNEVIVTKLRRALTSPLLDPEAMVEKIKVVLNSAVRDSFIESCSYVGPCSYEEHAESIEFIIEQAVVAAEKSIGKAKTDKK
jgi:hypothetical protein